MPTPPYHLPRAGMTRAAGVYPTVIVGVTLTLIFAFWMGTEVAAGKWGFSPALGKPWVGRIYPPWGIVTWMMRFHWGNEAMPVFQAAWKMIGFDIALGFFFTFWLAIQKAKRYGEQSDIHGSAQWGTVQQLRESKLLTNQGLFVGMWEEAGGYRALRDPGPEPVLVVAPNRSGKGVGVVIPNLLTWEESCVVLDPKKENWEATAGWRKAQGQLCITLDPTDATGTTAKWNPLLDMPEYPADVAYIQNVVLAIMADDEERQKGDIHWEQTAAGLMTAIALHVVYAEQNKSLEGCFYVLANPSVTIAETLERIRTTEHDPEGKYDWRDPLTGEPTKTHPVIAVSIRAVENKAPNDRSSVISTAEGYFNLYRDPTIAANTRTSDFSVRDLIDLTLPPVTVYITVPVSEQSRLKPLIRILFYQLLHFLTTTMQSRALGWAERGGKGRRVLIAMDEFPILGKMTIFHDTLPVLASFGVKVLLVAQTTAQIRAAYGRNESLTGNCTVKVFFRPEKIETAEELSRECGQATVYVQERTYTGHRWDWVLTHVIANERQVQRPLMTADEIMRLDDDKELLFYRGIPYLANKIRYYEDEGFLSRSLIQAPTESDRIQGRGQQWTTRQPATGAERPHAAWFLSES